MGSPLELLQQLKACYESQEWAAEHSSLNDYELWRKCQRGDWLLWLAMKVGVDRKKVVFAACQCARTALQFVPDGEDRPRKAIEIAEAWTRGEASYQDLRKVAAAAADAARCC